MFEYVGIFAVWKSVSVEVCSLFLRILEDPGKRLKQFFSLSLRNVASIQPRTGWESDEENNICRNASEYCYEVIKSAPEDQPLLAH